MITTSYSEAASDFSHQCPPPGYWGALLLVTISTGQQYYRAIVSAKCKRCRKTRLKSGRPAAPHGIIRHALDDWHQARSTGHTCTICGNPYAGRVTIGRYSCLGAGRLH
jgi:hypothetical protein